MNERLNWMLPSFEIPRIGSLRIRISFAFLLFAPIFLFRLGATLGSAVLGILFLSILLHELGHVCLARLTGGTASEIHLSPIGGLAIVQPGRGTWSQIVTLAAGPFVNLVICLTLIRNFYDPETFWSYCNPFRFPLAGLANDQLVRDLSLAAFAVNWMLFLLNLLPVLPLDGARMIRALLLTRIHPELVNRCAVQISMVGAAVAALVGLVIDVSPLVFLSGLLFVVNLVEFFENELIDREEDSFLGYDFSEGYTSLDRSAPATAGTQAADAQRGLIDQWRERRRQQRELAMRRQQEEAELRLDELLAKVHEHGIGSLTSREQQMLKQVSDLLRDRGKRPS